MSYTALYRKFRPQEFSDVKGQDHIVTSLQNQIKADRIGHAYLFCGTRGTGKTSVAKIFAKAVNCLHPVEGSPCGECELCRSVAAGTSMNVIEIDAASNNGVDNIREIREEVGYGPTEGRFKVYIIDEVHMLSPGAFNALLKTLEEPPAYVIFILATTEVHKIPVTILSRCQRYDFHRIPLETIASRLTDLLRREGVKAEEKAVRYIAKAADGSMRDALSLLDQCIAFYLGQELTYDGVLSVLGAVDTDVFSRLLTAVKTGDVPGAMEIVEEVTVSGKELNQFAADFCWYLRNLLLMKSAENIEDLLDLSSENLEVLKSQARETEAEVLMRYIRVFSGLTGTLRYSTEKRILVEVALIKLCKPEMETSQDAIIDRIVHLEEAVAKGMIKTPHQQEAAVPPGAFPANAAPPPRKKAALPKAVPEDIKRVVAEWKTIAGAANVVPMVQGFLRGAHLSVGGEGESAKLLLVFDDHNGAGLCEEEENLNAIKEAIASRIGKEVEIEIRENATGRPSDEIYPDLRELLRQNIKMEIEIED